MNILIVEDENLMAQILKKILKKIDCVNVIKIASTFEEAYQNAMGQVFDIILVDIVLEEDSFNGLDLCRFIRRINSEVALIVITAMHSIHYLEQAFASGVNDYITKPFHYKEVEIRVKHWLQMSHKVSISKTINYNNLTYDTVRNEFYFYDKLLKLTKKEKILLLVFLKKAEQVLNKYYLQEKVWGDIDLSVKKRNIRSLIQLLRRVLPVDWIKTIRGEGYMLRKS